MRKAIASAAVAALAVLSLAACGQAPGSSPTTGGASAGTQSAAGGSSNFKACMVSDQGGFDDKSFNQSGLEGVQKAVKDFGIAESHIQSTADSDYAPNIQNMINQKCDLIFTVGFNLADATKQAATANPNVHFSLIDSTISDASGKQLPIANVKPLVFNTAEADFLAGYLAAAMSKTGMVGTYGGQQIPSVTIFMDGFADGIAYYNQENGKDVKLLGWDKAKQTGQFAGSFTDASKGQSITQSLLGQGADIIHPVAGGTGTGTLAAVQAANAQGKSDSVIWVDADGFLTNPDYGSVILSSVMKEISTAVYDTIKDAKDGNWDAKNYVGTLQNEGVGLAPFHDFDSKVPADVKTKLEQIKADIVSGKIKVTSVSAPTS